MVRKITLECPSGASGISESSKFTTSKASADSYYKMHSYEKCKHEYIKTPILGVAVGTQMTQ